MWKDNISSISSLQSLENLLYKSTVDCVFIHITLAQGCQTQDERLESGKHVWFDKQQIKRIIVNFSCQER